MLCPRCDKIAMEHDLESFIFHCQGRNGLIINFPRYRGADRNMSIPWTSANNTQYCNSFLVCKWIRSDWNRAQGYITETSWLLRLPSNVTAYERIRDIKQTFKWFSVGNTWMKRSFCSEVFQMWSWASLSWISYAWALKAFQLISVHADEKVNRAAWIPLHLFEIDSSLVFWGWISPGKPLPTVFDIATGILW